MNKDINYILIILEPSETKRVFEAHIEEFPEITTEGTKIREIQETLLDKLYKKHKIKLEPLQVGLSVRVKINF